jgi:Ser/Thr protein kinase RdoA (MazF antagonist)
MRTAPLLASLPRSAIHNDLNDHNVLIGGNGDVERLGQRVTGIVDFGDMVYSYRVGDLAIAIAYAMLGARDPLTVAASIVRGYSSAQTLTDAELAALYGLVTLRLCTSACIAAEQIRQRPDNEYLAVSQAPIRATLPLLAKIPFGLAEADVARRGRCAKRPGGRARDSRFSSAPTVSPGARCRSPRRTIDRAST